MKAFFCEINGTLVSLALVEELKVLSMKASGPSALESSLHQWLCIESHASLRGRLAVLVNFIFDLLL